MARPEVTERRLRLASFLFIVAGIFLAFGSFVIAEKFMKPAVVKGCALEIPESSAEGKLNLKIATLSVEVFVNRCLLMALFFLLMGILFLLYLVLGKLQIIEAGG